MIFNSNSSLLILVCFVFAVEILILRSIAFKRDPEHEIPLGICDRMARKLMKIWKPEYFVSLNEFKIKYFIKIYGLESDSKSHFEFVHNSNYNPL
jgi:hypothetical protein